MSAPRIPRHTVVWLPRRADVRIAEPANDPKAADLPPRTAARRRLVRTAYTMGWRLGFGLGLTAGCSAVCVAFYVGTRFGGVA